MKITRNTLKAIQRRLDKGETRFYISAYWYEANINSIVRRREQRCGYTPTSDWELVCSWNPPTWKIVSEEV